MNRFVKILIFIILTCVGFSQKNVLRKINDVNLIGVVNFKEKQIRDILRVHEAKFLSKLDFDRRLIKLDAISIKTFYVSKGFLGVTVKDSISITNNLVDINFQIIIPDERY